MSFADKDKMSVLFTRTGPLIGRHMDADTVKRNTGMTVDIAAGFFRPRRCERGRCRMYLSEEDSLINNSDANALF